MRIVLNGPSGNAFHIMNVVSEYLKESGQKDKIAEYTSKAMSGDYDHLLEVSQEYCPEMEFVRVR